MTKCVWRGKAVKALALILVLLASLPASAQQATTGRATMKDADTIIINGRQFRLWGIDAPEREQTCRRDRRTWECGAEAIQALERLIGRNTVTCRTLELDRYRRDIALCYLGGEEINRWMVTQGWAVAYRQFSEAYVPEEDLARAARRGLWTGTFVMPSDWRKGHRR
jgi:endonuclease YncB( thermonuclease family)